MKERIVELRKTLKLSQTEFSKRLNLTQNFISFVEIGKRQISDRTIKDICREFNVSEEWLRTGEGDMFAPADFNSELAEMVANMANTSESHKTKLLLILSQADEKDIEFLYNIAKNWVDTEKGKDD